MTIAGFNKKTVLGGVCVVLLSVGSVLVGTGPADARAQQPLAADAMSSGPLEITVQSVTLMPGVTAEHALQIALQVRCVDDAIFIEWASGTVRLDLGNGSTIDVPLQVGEVQPGAEMTAFVTIDWDERNALHRQLRRHATSAQATFIADSLRMVGAASAADSAGAIASRTDEALAPVRNSLH